MTKDGCTHPAEAQIWPDNWHMRCLDCGLVFSCEGGAIGLTVGKSKERIPVQRVQTERELASFLAKGNETGESY